MKKTLLLCFIHGFKGGDDTFGGFPEHLRVLVGNALPKIAVTAVTYPQFETRGDLKECVGRFREWSVRQTVIDLEVSASTSSPTIDPSVRTILIGHSMGGIVAAETLLAIASDDPVSPTSASPRTAPSHVSADNDRAFMFPHIQGLLAFDTPYLGIAPGVVAHGAESHYKTATTAYSTLSEIAGTFGWGTNTNSRPQQSGSQQQAPKAIGAGPEAAKDALAASMTASNNVGVNGDAAATPTWQRWGRVAMFAGAAGAVAAGGAAAYMKRNTITEGWSWVGSHLEFVGCLMRGEELQSRLQRVIQVSKERDVGFADLVTVLGKGATPQGKTTVAGGFVEIGNGEAGDEGRTFCTLPKRATARRKYFEKVANAKAGDETGAHMSMFFPREHPGYYRMSERAKTIIVGWVERGWYESSEGGGDVKGLKMKDLGGEDAVLVD